MLCVNCGAPIHHSDKAGGWLHSQPLGQLRVSRREVSDIHADPPRKRQPLHHQTVIHPAESARYSTHNPRRRDHDALSAL